MTAPVVLWGLGVVAGLTVGLGAWQREYRLRRIAEWRLDVYRIRNTNLRLGRDEWTEIHELRGRA